VQPTVKDSFQELDVKDPEEQLDIFSV
jgi:hypothetical protein